MPIIIPYKMDKMLIEKGYTKCCDFELRGSETKYLNHETLGQSFVIRIDRYIDDGGREASYAWNALFNRIETNYNTGKPEYLFNYEHPLWPVGKACHPAYVINQGMLGYSLYKLTTSLNNI